jgi:hypothetical protein
LRLENFIGKLKMLGDSGSGFRWTRRSAEVPQDVQEGVDVLCELRSSSHFNASGDAVQRVA